MRRLLLGYCVGFLLATGIALAAFTPKGVTHSNLFGVLEQTSPTSVVSDRPLIEFTTPTGALCVVTWKAVDGTFVAIDTSSGATCATVTTTTTTSTSTTTAVSTTTTTAAPTTTTTA